MEKAKTGKAKRFAAILGLIAIVFCLLAMFYNIIVGGDPKVTLMYLFCLIVIPGVIYIFLMFFRQTRPRDTENE